MKKILCLFLVLTTFFCLAACSEQEEKGDLYYIQEMTADGQTISASQLEAELAAEGAKLNDMFYIRLNKNGTGELCARGEKKPIQRDTTHIWPVGEEEAKMAFTMEGDLLTIQDGDALLVFKKN